MEVEPIECLENCDNYEEFLAGGFVYTCDVSKCLLFGNETFRSLCAVSPLIVAAPLPPCHCGTHLNVLSSVPMWNPSKRSDAKEPAVFTLSWPFQPRLKMLPYYLLMLVHVAPRIPYSWRLHVELDRMTSSRLH